MFTKKTATRIAVRNSSQRQRNRRSCIGRRSFGRDAGRGLSSRAGDLEATEPPAEDEVHGYRDQDEGSEHGVAPELAELGNPEKALVEEVDEHRPEQGSEERARATEDVHPTDDGRGDGLELEAGSGDDGDRPETAEEHEAGKACKRSGRDERSEDDAIDAQAGLARGVRVRADRVDPAAPLEIPQHPLQAEDQDDRSCDYRPDVEVADAEEGRVRELDQPVGERVRCDRLGFGVVDEPRSIDGERPERDDDRWDTPVGDENAVDGPQSSSDRHRQPDCEQRRCVGVALEVLPGAGGRHAGDRADRQGDVPGQDDDGLAGGEDSGDCDARRDAVEEAAAQVVVDQEAEEQHREPDDDHQRELAEPLRPEAENRRHSAPIAAVMTRSSVASARSNSPIWRPSRMTRTRSLIASTSGRSDEMRMIAIPARASSSMIWCTSAFAPTSMPRVGSSRMSTSGLAFSHLASMVFCWLPPDSCATGVSSDCVRIESFFRKPSATPRSADESRSRNLVT